MPCVLFKDILLILKNFSFFFSISKPSLSGSEWLMILRWIVERSSSGSARPLGGPGPPIVGFVMVCPWRPRYLPRYTVPLSFCWLHNGTSELFQWNCMSTICSIILCSISIFTYDVPLHFFFPCSRVELKYWMEKWPFTRCSRRTRGCTSVSQKINTEPSTRMLSSRF